MNKKLILALLVSGLLLLAASCLRPELPAPSLDLDLPAPEPAPPALHLLTEEGDAVPENTVSKIHVIGTSPCPDPFEALVIELDPGEGDQPLWPIDWEVSGVPQWLDLPDFGPFSQAFVPRFNCNIDNFTEHTEEAVVVFTPKPNGIPEGEEEPEAGEAAAPEEGPLEEFRLETSAIFRVQLRITQEP